MKPRIETSHEMKIVGKRQSMSFANYNVAELWKDFLPRRYEITNNRTSDLISMAIYKPGHFADSNATTEFEKWAAVEVTTFDHVPYDMEKFILAGGLYAIFDYKGLNTDDTIFRYIFETWLPVSGYNVDHRPHFEILGDKYKNNDPASEEEIWIPIKPGK